MHFLYLHSCLGPSSRRTEKEEQQWVCLTLLESKLLWSERKVPFFQRCGSVGLQCHCCCPLGLPRDRDERIKKGNMTEKQECPSTLPHIKKLLYTSYSRTRRLLEFILSMPRYPLPWYPLSTLECFEIRL